MAIFTGPAYDKYVTDLSRAELAPTTFDYNIDANKAAGNFIQDKISETIGDNPISKGLGEVATYGAVPFAFYASPFHEAMQVVKEGKLKDYGLPYSGDFANFTKAMLDQRVPQTMAERAGGVLQSTGLGQGIYDLAGKTQDIVSGIRQRSPGVTGTDYFNDINISQPPGTDVGIMSDIANLFGSSARADEPMNIEDFQVQNIEDRSIASVPSNFLNYRFQNARTPLTPVKEGITTLRDQLGNLKDKGLNFLGSGKDLALKGIGSIIRGPVGSLVGTILGGLKESPTDKFNLEIGREFGDQYGYKSALQHGNLGARQDPFGRNLASFAGNYEKNRRAEIARLSKLKELTKFQKDKLDFGKKYLQKLEQKRQAKIQEMQDKNRADRRGGYQSSFAQDKDFMEGSGTAAEMGSS